MIWLKYNLKYNNLPLQTIGQIDSLHYWEFHVCTQKIILNEDGVNIWVGKCIDLYQHTNTIFILMSANMS